MALNSKPSSLVSTSLFIKVGPESFRPAQDIELMQAALGVLEGKLYGQDAMESPNAVRNYVRLKLGMLAHEVFAIIFMDSQHRVLRFVELFRGTINQTAVYAREVVKEALAINAAAVILVHNHPSGVGEPSSADKVLTKRLADALGLIDVRVVDHLVVAGPDIVSFAERGLI